MPRQASDSIQPATQTARYIRTTMKPNKRSKPAAPASESSGDSITVTIPKNKAAGGAAGAVVGGIMGGPVGAVFGGVIGASLPGNTDKVKKAVYSGVAAAKKSSIGKFVQRTASRAGK